MLLLSHAWFGAEEELEPQSAVRALLVRYLDCRFVPFEEEDERLRPGDEVPISNAGPP